MGYGAVASRRHAELAGIGLCIRNELGEGFCWNGWMHLHNVGHTYDARNGCNVANEIETELVVERRVDRVRRTNQEERMPICGCAHDRLGHDIAAGTRPIL